MQSNLTVIHLFTIEWSLFSLWKKAASKPWAEIALEEEKGEVFELRGRTQPPEIIIL